MANDFKRMWTREELEDTYKLDKEFDNNIINLTIDEFNKIKHYSKIKKVS